MWLRELGSSKRSSANTPVHGDVSAHTAQPVLDRTENDAKRHFVESKNTRCRRSCVEAGTTSYVRKGFGGDTCVAIDDDTQHTEESG